jgi:hypothetical protein
MRMLSPEPENRFTSLIEVGAALLPFASEHTRHAMASAFHQNAVTTYLWLILWRAIPADLSLIERPLP